MTIYIDLDCKCHVSNPDGAYREFEVSFFDGKCASYVEGFRYVPAGESWTRNDGVAFTGEMVASWKPDAELDAAQREHEKQLLAEYEAALSEIETALGV